MKRQPTQHPALLNLDRAAEETTRALAHWREGHASDALHHATSANLALRSAIVALALESSGTPLDPRRAMSTKHISEQGGCPS